ncbi:MAG: crossover junction endodeoxyribonuclease RuvC [Clostridia bacterium]|nr:crossover junction endodeoxyribonuclease RuvC [Clostridia bacterium]
MIVLGIDPGFAIVGFGVVEKQKSRIDVVDYGVITTPKEDTLPIRLEKIYRGMCELIDKYKPDHIAVEELFFNTNITTGIAVAEARGVILLACINKGCKLFEYTPLQIKQALTGNGRADKHQVQFMVKAILKLNSIPRPDDAADGLAAALCHSQTNLLLAGTDIK